MPTDEKHVDSGSDTNHHAPVDSKLAKESQLSELSGSEEGSYDADNPFKDPTVAQHWREVYENSQYECRHVFDPTLTWSEEEEKRLVRKLDWRVCLWAVSRCSRARRRYHINYEVNSC